MHTTVESAHINDVQLVIELIYHSLLNIKNQHDFKYININMKIEKSKK